MEEEYWGTGLELEVFCEEFKAVSGAQISEINQLIEKWGVLTRELGPYQLELITPPCQSYQEALNNINHIIERLPKDWEIVFKTTDPRFVSDKNSLIRKPRYNAMLEALAIEKPDSWHKVFAVANWCATHVNIGLSPWSPAGMLVMNILNNVGPYIASMTRAEFPESAGHLGLWSDWADYRRLPFYGEWYSNKKDYQNFFESLPSLIKGNGDKDGGEWQVDMVGKQALGCQINLGNNWKLCRPKWSNYGWYLEIRLLPSMSPARLEYYVGELLQGVVAIIGWVRTEGSRLYSTPEEAKGAFLAATNASKLFPPHVLSHSEWEDCFKR